MKRNEQICKDKNCGNYNGRYKNRCRALSFVPKEDNCFARMTKEEAEEADNMMEEAAEQQSIKHNKAYYQKHRGDA